MENSEDFIKKIKEEIQRLKLEIIEKENKIDELLTIIYGETGEITDIPLDNE